MKKLTKLIIVDGIIVLLFIALVIIFNRAGKHDNIIASKAIETSFQWTQEQTNRVFAVYYYDYSPLGKEAKWSTFLANKLKGYHSKQEVRVPYGRIDVETNIMSIEVDKIIKWHEGIGQCLHYAYYTKKTPTLAIIAPSPKSEYERDRLTMILDVCEINGIKVILMTQEK